MAITVVPLTTIAIATDPAATAAGKFTPALWNAGQQINQATGKILGRKTAATGATEELSLSDVLDMVGSAAQGDILFRGAAGWQRLAAGTAGYLLASQGAGADLHYIAASTGQALLAGGNTFSGAQIGGVTALTSTGASIAIDLSVNNEFSHTFTENTTIANPSNVVAGQSGSIKFTQHASSPKTLAFGSYYKFAGGSAPSVTATNSASDTLYYSVRSSTFIECVLQKAYA